MLPISVIVPVRNAENMVDQCLASIFSSDPEEVIVVDGKSTDHTLDLVGKYNVRILSDDGRGVSAARMIGIEAATQAVVMLIDVDILLTENSLANLYQEFVEGGYDALQAGLTSISGPGYWGQALTAHHNRGRSKNWPGVMATIFRRQLLLDHRFDERFRSGEDIELRWRLREAGLKLGVSRQTYVQHRFEDNYEFARDQFLADGQGLGRMVVKYGWRAVMLLGIPAAGSLRGILLCLRNWEPKWVPYYLAYFFYNYTAMPTVLKEKTYFLKANYGNQGKPLVSSTNNYSQNG
jgi:glycosyltransferase involved in cell wall biosynthesis